MTSFGCNFYFTLAVLSHAASTGLTPGQDWSHSPGQRDSLAALNPQGSLAPAPANHSPSKCKKSHSHSDTCKSRFKSRPKVKVEHESRRGSKEKSSNKKSQSRLCSHSERRNAKRASESPPGTDCQLSCILLQVLLLIQISLSRLTVSLTNFNNWTKCSDNTHPRPLFDVLWDVYRSKNYLYLLIFSFSGKRLSEMY